MGTSLTAYLKLIKPDNVEAINIGQLNTNADYIDKAVKALPRGIIYRTKTDISHPLTLASSIGWSAKNIKLVAGRAYKITFSGVTVMDKEGAFYRMAFCKTPNTDSATAITKLTALGNNNGVGGPNPSAGQSQPGHLVTSWDQTVDETVQLKLNAWITVGDSVKFGITSGDVILEDIGATV